MQVRIEWAQAEHILASSVPCDGVHISRIHWPALIYSWHHHCISISYTRSTMLAHYNCFYAVYYAFRFYLKFHPSPRGTNVLVPSECMKCDLWEGNKFTLEHLWKTLKELEGESIGSQKCISAVMVNWHVIHMKAGASPEAAHVHLGPTEPWKPILHWDLFYFWRFSYAPDWASMSRVTLSVAASHFEIQ